MVERQPVSEPKSILLVDDEQDILDILERVLQSAGYHVSTAHNGQQALQDAVAARQDYDLIITNIRMPVMDGRAFYRQLCALEPHLSQRVIFCTGEVADPSTQRFLRATGAPVLFKPFPMSALLEVVAQKLAECMVILQPPPMALHQSDTAIVLAS
jgi:CheY-like chemotaxis protein